MKNEIFIVIDHYSQEGGFRVFRHLRTALDYISHKGGDKPASHLLRGGMFELYAAQQLGQREVIHE